jgi:hypothetical protein
MKMTLSWALGFKLFTLAYGVGLVGAIFPSHQSNNETTEPFTGPTDADLKFKEPEPGEVSLGSEPLTRAVLDDIYFDIVRAIGQGEQLQVELRAYNTGADRSIVPGRAKGILEPALFATVFDEQGRRWYADQVRIGNATSTSGFLPESKLVAGVPTAMFLTFGKMPSVAGTLQIRTIPRLEVPVIVGPDQSQEHNGDGAVLLVFRRIPVSQ